ncbi:MAG TPA: DUF6528 family protein [Planctomycetota bacterium]|nr:DUF6528 family protein [Planctomycetota bacterium]
MSKSKRALLLLPAILASCATAPPAPLPSDVIVCGAEEVFVLSIRRKGEKVWSWTAAEHPEIPEPLRKKFGSTDDCKPVDGGRKVLITSSGGAVALVERPSGRVVFYAAAVNAHSAELLPNHRLIVASSTGRDGDRLILFDLAQSDKPLASDELTGAHGLVWDPERELLWALGTNELRAYEVQADRTTGALVLSRRMTHTLPNDGGHDLRPLPGSPLLNLTTHHHVWQFDRDLLTFRTHPDFGSMENVKCVDVNPASGGTLLIQAEISWWSEHLRFPGTDRVLEFKGRKLYKARWCPSLE